MLDRNCVTCALLAVFGVVNTVRTAGTTDHEQLLNTAQQLRTSRDISGAAAVYQDLLRNEHANMERQVVCAAHIGLGSMYDSGELSGPVQKMAEHYLAAASCGHAQGLFQIANIRGTGWMGGDGLGLAKGLTEYYNAAVDGHTGALLALGYRARYGRGTPKNCSAAAMYYELAANQHVDAMRVDDAPIVSETPLLHKTEFATHAMRTQKDLLQYFDFAAETGDHTATYHLGKLAYEGTWGTERDHARAARLFQRGASEGHAASTSALAQLYLHGLHFEVDRAKAYDLFSKAADQKDAAGMTGLALMLLDGTPGFDANRSYHLTKAAAALGNPQALYNHAVLHMGQGPHPYTRDFRKALQFFALALAQGHIRSIHATAHMQLHGIGAQANCDAAMTHFALVAEHLYLSPTLNRAHALLQESKVQHALVLFERAAQQGSVNGQLNAAWIYEHRCSEVFSLFARNDTDDETVTNQRCMAFAARLLSQASEQGTYWADVELGDVLYYGWTGTEDRQQAAIHYRRAATKAKSARAMFNIAYMHQFGIGMEQDLPLAERYYDMTLEVNPRAWAPVKVSLLGLHLQRAYLRHHPLLQSALAQTGVESQQVETLCITILSATVVIVLILRRLCR